MKETDEELVREFIDEESDSYDDHIELEVLATSLSAIFAYLQGKIETSSSVANLIRSALESVNQEYRINDYIKK